MNRFIYVLILVVLQSTTILFSQDKPDMLLEKGKLSLYNKDLKSSLDYLDRAIALDSTVAESYYYRGLVYLYNNDFLSSVKDFSRSIDLNKDFPDAYNNRGLAYSYLNEMGKAFEDYSIAIKLDPRFAEAYMNRGSGFMMLENYDSAKKDFEKAEKINSKNPELYYQLGRLNYLQNKYKDAVKFFGKSLELGLKSLKIYYNRANAYVKLEKFEEAVADYTVVLEKQPEDLDALNNRAYSYDKLGKSELAANDKQKLEEIRLKLYPPVIINSYNNVSDETGAISMDIPENWFFHARNTSGNIDFIISKDSINPDTDPLVYGAIGGLITNNLPNGLQDSSAITLMEYWKAKQAESSKDFETYKLISYKSMPFKGWIGYKNTLEVRYAEGYMTFAMTEFVLISKGNLFYCYFQVPVEEYAKYKDVFEKIENSVEIQLLGAKQ